MGGFRLLASRGTILQSHISRLLAGNQASSAGSGYGGLQSWVASAQRTGLCLHLSRLYSALPPHTELQMPALSPTMAQGNVASWNVKEGDEVAPGDMLADIETDKATLGWENMDDGFIAKILVPAGTKDVAVGTPLALLVEDADSVPAFKDYKGGASAGSSSDSNAKPASADAEAAAASTSSKPAEQKPQQQQEANSRIGPAAQWLLRDSGLSASDVQPTGPHGIITKGDVLAAIQGGAKPKPSTQAKEDARPSEPQAAKPQAPAASPPAAQAAPAPKPQPGARYTDTPNSQIRKIIAQRLLESKTKIPHAYFSATANIDGVAALRQTLKEQGQKVSVNDFVIRATALALQEVPAANAFWDEAKEDVKPADSIDIAIAVATDNGLITPIVAKANTKSLMQISAEVRELAARARANKLKPHEFQGGSFSISNLGMYGVDRFEAIINPPQACIMAVGGSQQHISMQQGKPVIRSQMEVTLSADNRVYDGAVAGDFLAAFCRNMENPVKLLV